MILSSSATRVSVASLRSDSVADLDADDVAVGGHDNADLPIVRTTVDDANPRADL
jgi:hypothetical protein